MYSFLLYVISWCGGTSYATNGLPASPCLYMHAANFHEQQQRLPISSAFFRTSIRTIVATDEKDFGRSAWTESGQSEAEEAK
jgi:hypothetical protein